MPALSAALYAVIAFVRSMLITCTEHLPLAYSTLCHKGTRDGFVSERAGLLLLLLNPKRFFSDLSLRAILNRVSHST